MKKEITYICEKCFEKFYSEEEAKKCESSHVNTRAITVSKYNYSLDYKYPEYIAVEMVDGAIVKYRKVDIVKEGRE